MLCAIPSAAQDSSTQNIKTPDLSAADLVRTCVAHEVAAANHRDVLHMFRSYRKSPKGSQTRLYAETKEALVAMVIATNDQALTPEEQQKENGHLGWLKSNPDQLRKKAAREKEDEERMMRIVKALPDAFVYQYEGTETADQSQPSSQLVKLSFTPNPAYHPPSRLEEALTGMQGELLIDKVAGRLAKIDGTLFRQVNFGWGIVGHLDQGGRFLVRQGNLGLGDDEWGITEVSLSVTGKLLLVKSISMTSDEVLSDFRKIPANVTFAQAADMLQAEQAKLPPSQAMAKDTQTR